MPYLFCASVPLIHNTSETDALENVCVFTWLLAFHCQFSFHLQPVNYLIKHIYPRAIIQVVFLNT